METSQTLISNDRIGNDTERLTRTEKTSAVLLAALGIILIAGSLLWLGLSTDDNALASKQTFTLEEPDGKKTVTETGYAETLVIAAITIGTVLLLVAAFFGRIREVKLGNSGFSLTERQSKAVAEGAQAAASAAKTRAPEGKQNEAAQLAIALAVPALLALVTGMEGVPNLLATEAIGRAAGIRAADEVEAEN